MMLSLFAVLLVLAAALLTRPWWHGGDASHMRRRAANVAAYRSRMVELDNDVSSGLLDASSAAALKQELAARLLTDSSEAVAETPIAATATRWPAAVAVLLLMGFSVTWYYLAGSWRTQRTLELARTNPEAAQTLSVEGMVEGLSQRLEQNPDDAEGWAMLGRSYFVMQRHAESAKAYARASELSSHQDADLLVGEGEALAMARDRDLQGRPQQLFSAALALDPNHGKALWYAGMAAAQAQNYDEARQHWLNLRQQELPEEFRAVLEERLQELAQLSGEPLNDAPAPAAAVAGLSLQVEVQIAPELAAKLSPQHTLFVFAKAENGPPMPLAVQRFTAPKLPLQLTLDDSMAMMPQLKLSQHDRWVLTARLTLGGTVQAESGDLQGQLSVTKAEAGKPIRIVINTQIP